jgi:cold shock CspA family protein
MRHATVKSYSPRDRYGFVTDEQGTDLFLSANAIAMAGIGIGDLVPGLAVLVDATLDRCGRGWRVTRIALADNSAVAA